MGKDARLLPASPIVVTENGDLRVFLVLSEHGVHEEDWRLELSILGGDRLLNVLAMSERLVLGRLCEFLLLDIFGSIAGLLQDELIALADGMVISLTSEATVEWCGIVGVLPLEVVSGPVGLILVTELVGSPLLKCLASGLSIGGHGSGGDRRECN